MEREEEMKVYRATIHFSAAADGRQWSTRFPKMLGARGNLQAGAVFLILLGGVDGMQRPSQEVPQAQGQAQ